MKHLFVFGALVERDWFRALQDLEDALRTRDKAKVVEQYSRLFGALAGAGHTDVVAALTDALVYGGSSLSEAALRSADIPAGLEAGALHDLETLLELARRDWAHDASCHADRELPPLERLAVNSKDPLLAPIGDALQSGEAAELLDLVLAHYRLHGTGDMARFEAFRWSLRERELEGIAHPSRPDAGRLVDVGRQLAQLRRNTEAFLAGRPAQHTLLYGPRGSGKSTAIRGLLTEYGREGLRLVELPVGALGDLNAVIEWLRPWPQRFILYVDDLSFEAESSQYGPLKTLLEGSLTERPANVLVYATSNRRHLVRERFSERPDPLDDDVHGWDSQHDKLALSDRFGLTITFPDATQARYLKIVGALAEQEGLDAADLDARAIRFAEWGNGYSGRTAQQFVESLKAEILRGV